MSPHNKIDAIVVFNSRNPNGDWIPTKVGVGSWVMLQTGKQGGHARDAQKHKGEVGYKVRIVKFKVEKGSSVVLSVYVQYAYVHRQLDLEPTVQHGGANYLYPSGFFDWVQPKSIIDVLYVLHADVGEPQRGHYTHKQLLKMGVYFYNALYIPRSSPHLFGRLESIPLPTFEDPEWPIPDITTSESFRSKLHFDFLNSIRPNTSSRSTHIQWFMPCHVMVDLFSVAAMHRTPTMFVCKNLSEECFNSIMDEGWDVKVTVGLDVIRCTVDRSSVIFRYHIGRSTFYVNFVYNRERLVGSTWENLEQVQSNLMVKITCVLPNCEEPLELEVGSSWSFASLRQEITLTMGYDDQHDYALHEYVMCISENGEIKEKINPRFERNRVVADVLPLRVLSLIPERT